ncbi:MAG: NUDIX hydrolase [Clostridiales bacterium]|nr:NUDIX hydrolase [Clostridiales bacterium]
MTGYNLVVVFNPDKKHVLLCKRIKNPYLGLSNFVGGHIEPSESCEDAAYRELFEETAITREMIKLNQLMTFIYYNQSCYVDVWCGRLKADFEPHGDENPLYWGRADDDYFDMTRFAGEGNMGHIMEQIFQFGDGYLD